MPIREVTTNRSEFWGRGALSAPVELDLVGNRGETTVGTTTGTDGAGGGSGGFHYVEIPCENISIVSLQWDWFDATLDVAGSAVIQFTNHPWETMLGLDIVAPASDDANDWVTDTSITVTGPAGSAAASEIITLSAVGYRRCRLRFDVSAAASPSNVAFATWGKS